MKIESHRFNFHMLSRDLYTQLLRLSQMYPALGILGPRQSGKTTLAKMTFPQKPYVSLENPDTCQRAREDPRSFLQNYDSGAIFDEIQNFPKKENIRKYVICNGKEQGSVKGIEYLNTHNLSVVAQ